jgi:hypothetical protein
LIALEFIIKIQFYFAQLSILTAFSFIYTIISCGFFYFEVLLVSDFSAFASRRELFLFLKTIILDVCFWISKYSDFDI